MMSVENERRMCGDEGVEAGRGPGQLDWYRFASRYVDGKSVLDVGCGLGHGLRILRGRAAMAHGQDLDPRLAGDDVRIAGVEEIASKSYDVVTSIDVVEHVPEPERFAAHLARIARKSVFVTTPNWTASRCRWPFHLREYTPRELDRLFAGLGEVMLFKGTPSGSRVYSIGWRGPYYALNDLRNWAPTGLAARCVNFALPPSLKIHSHLAVLVRVD